MTVRRLTIRVIHSTVLVAAAGVVVMAAACASPTSPTASNAAPALHNQPTSTVHDACGVGAGSDQHC